MSGNLPYLREHTARKVTAECGGGKRKALKGALLHFAGVRRIITGKLNRKLAGGYPQIYPKPANARKQKKSSIL
jgi:hypothetical protein